MQSADLEVFVEVADCGSFSRAAVTLGRSQPAVSRQIARLERDLGAQLLDRGGRGTRLTPAGERFLPFAEATLRELGRLRREFTGDAGDAGDGLAGVLRLAASTVPGQFLVPGYVDRFRATHPAVRAEVSLMDSAQVRAKVLAGTCDLGFVGVSERVPGIEHVPIAEDEIVLAVPTAHPLARARRPRLADLAGATILEREDGSGTRESVRRALAEQGKAFPANQTGMVLGTTEAIVSAADEGLGVGWVSARAIEQHRAEGVVAVRLVDFEVRRPLFVVHRPRATLNAVATAFLAAIANEGEAGRSR